MYNANCMYFALDVVVLVIWYRLKHTTNVLTINWILTVSLNFSFTKPAKLQLIATNFVSTIQCTNGNWSKDLIDAVDIVILSITTITCYRIRTSTNLKIRLCCRIHSSRMSGSRVTLLNRDSSISIWPEICTSSPQIRPSQARWRMEPIMKPTSWWKYVMWNRIGGE